MCLPQVARGAEVVGCRTVEHCDMDERSGLHRISPAAVLTPVSSVGQSPVGQMTYKSWGGQIKPCAKLRLSHQPVLSMTLLS
jgi:hypothetical protein